MNHRFCVLPGRHLREKIVGICLEEACSQSSLLCKYCYCENHEGHLVMTLEFLQSMNKGPSSAFSIKEMGQMEKQVQQIYKMIDESCKTLIVSSTEKITQDLSANKLPCLDMISACIQPIQIDQIYQKLSTSKVIPQELMNQYLDKLRMFYFEGSCSQSEIEQKKLILRSNLAQVFKKSQLEIVNILDNLRDKLLQFHTENFAIENQKEVKIEEKEIKLRQSQTVMIKNEVDIQEVNNQNQPSPHFNLAPQVQPERVILRETKECDINLEIFSFDVLSIKQLTLISTASMCAIDKQSALRIGKMVNLRALRIYWARGLSDTTACLMLKGLTELVQLCLSEFDNCTPFFVNSLKINNPKLKRLCLSLDIVHYLQASEEGMEFMPDTAYVFPPERSWITLSNELNDLQSLELHKPENVHHWVNFINRKANKIKEFSLLDLDAVLQRQQRLIEDDINYSILLKSLEKCKNLRSLRFQQASFDQKSLIRILESNPRLFTFIASQCLNFKNKTYQTLNRYCKQLKDFCVIMDDRLSVQNFWGMTSLKTLVLRGCWGIIQLKFIESLSKLQNIQCLSIDHNKQWVTGKTLRSLHKLPLLEVLNISYNDLSMQDALGFKHVPPLRTLICSGNKFSYIQLIQCPFSKNLKKLSIGKNRLAYPNDKDLEKIKMAIIVENFPSLTHLKLKGFKNIKPDFLTLLPRLICFSLVDGVHSDHVQAKRFCKNNEIHFNSSDIQ